MEKKKIACEIRQGWIQCHAPSGYECCFNHSGYTDSCKYIRSPHSGSGRICVCSEAIAICIEQTIEECKKIKERIKQDVIDAN